MRTYARNTKVFFETLSSIQDNAVYQALAEYDKSDSLEDLLYNTTYEAITSICELLDGYTSDKLQLDLIDTKSNKSIKEGIQMHDICANYLRWENRIRVIYSLPSVLNCIIFMSPNKNVHHKNIRSLINRNGSHRR